MAKLRVGDIVVDGSNVSTGGGGGRSNLVLGTVGALVAAGSLIAFLIGSAPSYGGLIGSAGGAMVILAGCRERLRRHSLYFLRSQAAVLAGQHSRQLASLLARSDGEQTIEQIVERSGLPLPSVVHALAHLRDKGELKEDLNTDSGEWHYALAPASSTSESPKNLDEWIGDLESNERR